MIRGPNLSVMRERAKTIVMRHFVRIAESDGTPATLRAMYVRKAEQAQLVVDGGESALIAGEAAVRGISASQMAELILGMAVSAGDQLEVARMGLNVEIDSAPNAGAIVAVLQGLGLVYAEEDPLS